MSAKMDEKTLGRLSYLLNQGLTQTVIAERLGVSTRTIRVYVRSLKFGIKPYQAPEKDPIVQPPSSIEEA